MSVAPIRTLKRNVGGAKITYYDNTTELGYQYVASGQDVLHPTLTMPTKSGKTFVGWSTTTSENNWVGELTANGQPMNLYAIYVDNSKTVVSNGTISDSSHVSGTARISTTARYEQASYASGSINLLKRRYQTATCTATDSFTASGDTGNLKVGEAWFDGDSINSWSTQNTSHSKTYTINDGSHSLYLYAQAFADGPAQNASMWVSITLSNPIAWT